LPLLEGRILLNGPESSTTITVTIPIATITITIFVLVVVIDIMPVDDHTAVAAATKQLANSRSAGPGRGIDVSADIGCGQGLVIGLVKFCGTKIRFRLESAATECEPDDCGMVSTRTLVMLTTPSTAPEPSGEPAGLTALLAPDSSGHRPR